MTAGPAPRTALARGHWPLMVFFAGLFVAVAGVGKAGVRRFLRYGVAVTGATLAGGLGILLLEYSFGRIWTRLGRNERVTEPYQIAWLQQQQWRHYLSQTRSPGRTD